jgi:CDP-diacylglycerol--serine O-phosphatidyltransferase
MADLFPPFAPDPLEPRRRLFKPVPFRVIAPNLITLFALCLGLTAIRLAYEGRLEPAVICIIGAGVLDGLDGRVARFLKGTSRFGAELDSLSDFICFGAAPGLILYGFTLHHLKGFGWVVALVLTIAMALRLARFNVMLDDPNRPEWKKDFFVGMPAPAGALTSLLPLYLSFLGASIGPRTAPFVAAYVLAIAFLTVSTIPTYSGKTMGKRVPRDWVLPIFVLTVALVGLLVSFPFESLALLTLVYLASIPFAVAGYRRFDRANAPCPPAQAPEAANAAGKQPEGPPGSHPPAPM